METIQGLMSLRTQENNNLVDHFILNLPMPPSENHAYPTGSHGRRFPSAELKRFRQAVRDWRLCNLQSANDVRSECQKWMRNGFMINLEIVVAFHFSSLFDKKGIVKKMDTSNRIKTFQDAFSEDILGIDDKMIWSVRATKIQIPDSQIECSHCLVQAMEPSYIHDINGMVAQW